MIFAVAMLHYALSTNFSLVAQINHIKNDYECDYTEISLITSNYNKSVGSLTREDIDHIEKNIAGKNFCPYMSQYLWIDDIHVIKLIFTNEHFGDLLMDVNTINNQKGYIGKRAIKYIKNIETEENASYANILFDEKITGIEIENLIPIEKLNCKKIGIGSFIIDKAMIGVDLTFDDCVILPIESYYNYNEFIRGEPQIILSKKYALNEDIKSIEENILSYLNEKYQSPNNNIYYKSQDLSIYIRMNSAGLMNKAEIFQLIACFVLCVILFGLSGLLLIIINRQKYDFSIELMCGATYKNIITKLLFEIFLLTALSTVVGLFIASLLLPLQSNDYFTLSSSVLSVLLCSIIMVFISVFVGAVSINKITKISPSEIFKSTL